MRRWMVQKNVPPDNVVTSTLIYWLGKNGMVCKERNLVDELERGFKPRCSSVSDDENSLGLESELEPAVTFKDNSGSPRKDCSSKVESCPLLGTFPERSGLYDKLNLLSLVSWLRFDGSAPEKLLLDRSRLSSVTI
uniref:Uncharacterized protein n=1 Tax=Oryza rufipogon TaxID=4529 RepID=A0A0E0QHA9_ORYRU